MRSGRALFAIGLVGSLAGNVFLLTRGGESEAEPPAQRTSEPASAPVDAPAIVVADASSAGAHEASLSPKRKELEARVAAAEATLFPLLPPEERFERSTDAPDVDARVRPLIERWFATAGDTDYTLTCRGTICRVDYTNLGWRDQLNADPERDGMFWRVTMMKGRVAFFDVAKEGSQKALAWASRILRAFDGSACTSAHPSPAGTVSLGLILDGTAARVTATGPLAAQPLGVCARRTLEDLIARDPVPAGATEVLDDLLQVTAP